MLASVQKTLRYVVFEQDGAFVAQCLDVDIASEGDSQAEALAALKEALELYFDGQATPAFNPHALSFGQIAIDA
jgi:predicted RNase H-like HicB family nuclease